MERSRNGGGSKVVTFDDAVIGRHRNGSLRLYHDIGCREVDAGRVLQPQGAASRRRTYADGELDVFSAERYFKGAMDGVQRKDGGPAVVVPPPLEKVPASARPLGAAVSKPVGTTTTRASAASVMSASSATSANSQTVLLRRHRRDHRDRKCCVQVGVLMRSCSGKRSVRVDSGVAKEAVPGTAGSPAVASKIDWYRELRMQKAALGLAGDDGVINRGVVAAAPLPPSLNLGTAKVAAVVREVIREDKPAEFTTSSSSRRRSFTLVAPPVRSSANEHEDDDDGAGSESSSDLFEIKSLMIEDCPYEPSEASVQWSVATASAGGASEPGDRVSARWTTAGSHRGRDGGSGPAVVGKQSRDRPAALLSGCVSHRAVEVSAAAKDRASGAPRRRGEHKARNGA